MLIEAGRRRYAVAQAQIERLGMLDPLDPPPSKRGYPLICRELGSLLGGSGPAPKGRRHALTVAVRRRDVALLIDHIDSIGEDEQPTIQPLGPIFARRLAWPWFLGAVIYREDPLLVLDLHRIAIDVAIGAVKM